MSIFAETCNLAWTEAHNIVQEAATKTIPKKRKCKKAKWLSKEALQIAERRRETKCRGDRESYRKLNAVKVLHSICQQVWNTQQWPEDWKRSVYIPIPKKGSAKECSNYRTTHD